MRMGRSTPLAGAVLIGALTFLVVAGCGSGDPRSDRLGSSNPLDRARAVTAAGRAGDVAALHKLVDLLDDSDAAVRMYAILALRRLCGEDFGYRYYASPAVRSVAVERWRTALRAGEVQIQSDGPRALQETAEGDAARDVEAAPAAAEGSP